MTTQASQVLSDALALSESDRARIAHELLQTLSSDDPSMLDDDELHIELDRRLEEYRRDASIGTSWNELRQEFLE